MILHVRAVLIICHEAFSLYNKIYSSLWSAAIGSWIRALVRIFLSLTKKINVSNLKKIEYLKEIQIWDMKYIHNLYNCNLEIFWTNYIKTKKYFKKALFF